VAIRNRHHLGALSSSLGIPDPPIVLFLSNLDLPKENFRATLVAYFVLIDFFSYIALFVTNILLPRTFLMAITFIPFTFLGIFIGNKIFGKIPTDKFKGLVLNTVNSGNNLLYCCTNITRRH